jgi:YD repeat-containing protein
VSDHMPVMRLPVPAAPYSGDGLEVAFGPDERGQVQAYLHTGTETIALAWDPAQASWAGTLADGRSFQVIPAMVVIARPSDETAPMLWRKVVM